MSAAQRKDESFLAFEATVVTTLLIAGVSQRVALGLLGISRGSWQYRTRPRPGVAEVTPRSTRTAPSWLSAAETEQILDRIKTGFGQGRSVYQCFYQALDAGEPTASLTSWYRIARGVLATSTAEEEAALGRDAAVGRHRRDAGVVLGHHQAQDGVPQRVLRLLRRDRRVLPDDRGLADRAD
jgi:transposase